VATVTLFTAARMAAIEAKAVVSGVVNAAGNLILSRQDGTTIDAGLVKGANGAPGSKWHQGTGAPAGSLGVIGDWYTNLTNYDIYEKTGASAWTARGNIKGGIGPQGPVGVLWRGAWAPNTAYAVNDAVTYNGSTYRRTVAGTSGAAFSATNWEVLAQGATGSGLTLETATISASGAFSGSFDLLRFSSAGVPKFVLLSGWCDNDVLADAAGLVDTGATIPLGWRPLASFVTEPNPPWGTSSMQYRFRINTQSTTDGKILVQRNGVNTTNMVIDSTFWLL